MFRIAYYLSYAIAEKLKLGVMAWTEAQCYALGLQRITVCGNLRYLSDLSTMETGYSACGRRHG